MIGGVPAALDPAPPYRPEPHAAAPLARARSRSAGARPSPGTLRSSSQAVRGLAAAHDHYSVPARLAPTRTGIAPQALFAPIGTTGVYRLEGVDGEAGRLPVAGVGTVAFPPLASGIASLGAMDG